jgi:hypothetical protein
MAAQPAIVVDVEAGAVNRAKSLFKEDRKLLERVPDEIGAVEFAGFVASD